MSLRIEEAQLPVDLSPFEAVELAYPAPLARIEAALERGLSVLVECDKELVPYLFKCVRDRLKPKRRSFAYLDGRAAGDPSQPASSGGLVASVVHALREAVRAGAGDRVLALPHLDLLVSSSGLPTTEAREIIPLLYENPELVFLGFRDPSFPIPRVVESVFPRREVLLGVPRDRLGRLVTQRESRKLSAARALEPLRLYTHVSGVNAVRLRRLLASLSGEDYPADARPALAQLRQATLLGQLTLPDVDLERDIGGYRKVKERLRRELLDVLAARDALDDEAQARRVEQLLPRGLVFWGPPGTGKTLFAKAMATALGAAVTIVSGPELKSKWVGESEENLRQLFVRARQAAPAVIVFDELDAFATARGTYQGSGVEHSMVNQLLAEMDGFRSDELVFVVATTNLLEAVDPALLRPGRFEFHLHIPYPSAEDRREILRLFDERLGLSLSARALDYAVRRTADPVEGQATRYTGDHLQALCRTLARRRLREGTRGPTELTDVEWALGAFVERPALSKAEQLVVATHEAGHAVCALFTPTSPPIERISIQGDLAGSLGAVAPSDTGRRLVVTRAQLLDQLCVLLGGREAEALLLTDVSIGAAVDLERATAIARAVVERFGLGGEPLGLRVVEDDEVHALSDGLKAGIEAAVQRVLETERARARSILEAERRLVLALRGLLVERQVLDRAALAQVLPGPAPHPSAAVDAAALAPSPPDEGGASAEARRPASDVVPGGA